MAWIFLIVAAILEICWMYSLKALDMGKIKDIVWVEFFSNTNAIMALLPLIAYIVFGLANVTCFSMATKEIPMSMAFGIWMGLALVGARLIDSTIFKEPFTWQHAVFISMIVAGIIGLKTSTAS